MEFFEKLGIDTTLLHQLVLFCISYIALSRFLFKPYQNAYHKRLEATFGNQEAAEQLNEKSKELHIHYETKAREVNSRVQSFFEQAHKEAQAVQGQTIEKARKQAEELVQKTRQEILAETTRAREDLKKLIPDLSQEIERKILSRDI